MCRSGPGVRALGESGEGPVGLLKQGRRVTLASRVESGIQRETSLVSGHWGWGCSSAQHFGSYGETRGNALLLGQRGAGCLLYNVRARLCQPSCGPGACGIVALAMHVGWTEEGGGVAAGRGWEGVGAELLIRD